MNSKGGYLYIVSNRHRTTLYIGVTSNLRNRSWEHKSGLGSKFTMKYNCFDLLYFEYYEDIESAIRREKKLKKWRREWKENLIKSVNPEMKDLYDAAVDFD